MGEANSPQKRTSSTSSMKFLHFYLFSWVIFALLDLDPDPADQNQCGSGSTTLGIDTFGNNLNHSTTYNTAKKFLVAAVLVSG
jgi:hypothetical protein